MVGKRFQIYDSFFKFTGRGFAIQKIESKHFYLCLFSSSYYHTTSKEKYSFPWAAFFGKFIPPQQKKEGGETMIILSMFGTAAWNFY